MHLVEVRAPRLPSVQVMKPLNLGYGADMSMVARTRAHHQAEVWRQAYRAENRFGPLRGDPQVDRL